MKPRLLCLVLVLILASLACNMPVAATITQTSEISAILTQTAMNILQPSEMPATLEGSPTPQTATPGAPTQTSGPPTAMPTATSIPCDAAGFIQDVTIPDRAEIPAGQSFTKTWRLRNNGTCTWTTSYGIVFTSGSDMNAPTIVNFSESVPPQATVDISVNMQAPETPGMHTGYWKLRNGAGQLFGVMGDQPFFVMIEVIPAPTPTVTPTFTATPTQATTPTPTRTATLTQLPGGSGSVVYDFAAGVCKGEWRSQAGDLDCPGRAGDSDGAALLLENPVIETGATVNQPVILTMPRQTPDGAITGRFADLQIQGGYRFQATLACLNSAPDCDVIYQVNYDADGSPQNLGEWTQTHDGAVQAIDVDLSSLAGRPVDIILVVLTRGPADQAQAVWVNPRIVNQSTGEIHD